MRRTPFFFPFFFSLLSLGFLFTHTISRLFDFTWLSLASHTPHTSCLIFTFFLPSFLPSFPTSPVGNPSHYDPIASYTYIFHAITIELGMYPGSWFWCSTHWLVGWWVVCYLYSARRFFLPTIPYSPLTHCFLRMYLCLDFSLVGWLAGAQNDTSSCLFPFRSVCPPIVPVRFYAAHILLCL